MKSLLQRVNHAGLTRETVLCAGIPHCRCTTVERLQHRIGSAFLVVLPCANRCSTLNGGMLIYSRKHPGGIHVACALFAETYFIQADPGISILPAGEYQFNVLDILQSQAIQRTKSCAFCIGFGFVVRANSCYLRILLTVCADEYIKIMDILAKVQLHLLQIHRLSQRIDNAGFFCKVCFCFGIPEGLRIVIVGLIAGPLQIFLSIVLPLANELGSGYPRMLAERFRAHHPACACALCTSLMEDHFIQNDPKTAIISAGEDQLNVLNILKLQTVQGTDIGTITISGISLVFVGKGDRGDLLILLICCAYINIKIMLISAEVKFNLANILSFCQPVNNTGRTGESSRCTGVPAAVDIAVKTLLRSKISNILLIC